MALRSVHLLKRADREFAKNLIWMVVFGSLVAILVAATDLPLVGAMSIRACKEEVPYERLRRTR